MNNISKHSHPFLSVCIVAGVFAFTIFAQCVLFHYIIYKEILFSSLWHSPVHFFRFYRPAATMALFFAGLAFMFKNKWWLVVASFMIDVWIFSNIWYFRTFGILVDKYAISMITNLNGFLDSILVLIQPIDFLFLLLTIILLISIIVFKNQTKSPKIAVVCIVLSLLMGLTNGYYLVKKYGDEWSYMNPLRTPVHYYVADYTAIHQLLLTIKEYALTPKEEKYILTEQEKSKADLFINAKPYPVRTDQKLILCIIESLNSFVVTEEIMPNLRHFVDTCNHVLSCDNIVTQAKAGGSSDGLLILQTGLLPLRSGAVCYRFCFNSYPALSHIFENTTILLPHEKHVYNQERMNAAYGIGTCFANQPDDDKELFKITIQQAALSDYVLSLTISTHIPCTKFADSSALSVPDTIPTLLRNYIKCANVLDKGIKILLDSIANNERLKNSTVVFTGDHALPVPIDENFGYAYNYSRFIPVIIYSPNIPEKTIIADTCYQMDIYPTILHLIGCEDYYWKGFGVNLLDSTARLHRPMTIGEAVDLSDKLIRADYFSQFQ